MGLLDALFGTQAQAPGATQQPSGLQQLFQPEVAMPIAAALLGGQGDAKNFGNAFAAYGQTKAQTAQKNKTMDFFRQNAPEYAAMVDSGLPLEDAWKSYTQQKYAQKGQGLINAGGGNLYDSVNHKWISAPGGGVSSKAGLTPVLLQNDNGDLIYGQATQDGKIVASSMPDGFKPVSPYQKSFETNRGMREGQAVGTAAGALPGVTQLAQNIDQQVNDLKNDPKLPDMVGPVYGRLPNITADAERVQQKINQLQGGAFLQARQMLKGGGAITDYEGRKAEEAYTRLSQAQNLDDFKRALDDFNMYTQQGLQKLQAQAGQQRLGQPMVPSAANPPLGGAFKTQSGINWSIGQ
jgi:hypothetical protein